MEGYCRLLIVILCSCAGSSLSFSVKRSVICGSPTPITRNNGEIISHAGFYQGHHYGKNMNCTWVIQAPAGKMVELVARNFSVSTGSVFSLSSCYHDYLKLYDGPSINSPSLGRFCGDSFKPISSTGMFLTLQFVTDHYSQAEGFKLFYNFTDQVVHSCGLFDWQCDTGSCISQTLWCDGDDDCGDDSDETNCPAPTCMASQFQCINSTKCIYNSWRCDGDDDCDNGSDEWPSTCDGYSTSTHNYFHHTTADPARACGQLNYTGTSGTIQTIGYPVAYPTHAYCDYQIFAPASTHSISFVFNNVFSIEDNSYVCKFDYVTIYSTNHANTHGPYCGSHAPANFSIPSNHATVHFIADGSVQKKGFQLTWIGMEDRNEAWVERQQLEAATITYRATNRTNKNFPLRLFKFRQNAPEQLVAQLLRHLSE